MNFHPRAALPRDALQRLNRDLAGEVILWAVRLRTAPSTA